MNKTYKAVQEYSRTADARNEDPPSSAEDLVSSNLANSYWEGNVDVNTNGIPDDPGSSSSDTDLGVGEGNVAPELTVQRNCEPYDVI